MGTVVVGVDGSERAQEALRLAASEARCRSGRLRAIYVYEPVRRRQTEAAAAIAAAGMWSTAADRGDRMIADAYRHDDEEREQARRYAEGRLRQFVGSVRDDLAGVEVDQVVVGDRHPSDALLRASQDADLLVVGSRGLGGFTGLLLGSISQQCVQHAKCPVLVVRPPTST